MGIAKIQPEQNMMKPELSGIHVNFSFEVSSDSGHTVNRTCIMKTVQPPMGMRLSSVN